MNYHIWTIGCQMNKAESNDIDRFLESCGWMSVKELVDADLVIINTCVVRQHAEDKIKSLLGHVKRVKTRKSGQLVAVTGCFVGSDTGGLLKKYPQVDLFFRPGDLESFKGWHRSVKLKEHSIGLVQNKIKVSAYLPIMQGCDNFCSYCIVPFRRGHEISRPVEEILRQAREHAAAGAREIILLGQNVNSYGKGLQQPADLACLLKQLNDIEGLARIRFLTNHPRDMSRRLIEAIASNDKVCHHICLPLQSGDDQILEKMNRNYTYAEYHALVDEIRAAIPDISLSTDIIVGFPGENVEQFDNTLKAIQEIRFDSVHVACYSPRPETLAARFFEDNVPVTEKKARLHNIEQLQKSILQENNAALLQTMVKVLIEGRQGSKWFGRAYHDKLVFTESDVDILGCVMDICIESATPWSLRGKIIYS